MAPSSKKRSRKGSSKSPRKTRKRMARTTAPKIDSDDFNNEDYNIRSPERTKALTKIKERIGDAPVSPALWACCQLADVNYLQEFATSPRTVILSFNCSSNFLPLLWTQRFRDSQLPGSEGASIQRSDGPKKRKLNADGQAWVPRSGKEVDKCKERDNYKCVLTNQEFPDAAHIFPYNMLNSLPKEDKSKGSACTQFWGLLYIFWGEDRVNKWKKAIFPDSRNPRTGVDRCFNLISLDPSAHSKWSRGLFALKPLKLSSDRKQLTVQFFWQVPSKYDIASRIDLLTEPISSKGLDRLGNASGCLPRCVEDLTLTPYISSGDVFTLTTKDPEKLPLPSMDLLEMQWVLQRLVGMSGAAGWPALDLDDDDSVEDGDAWRIPDDTSNVDDTLKRVYKWVISENAASITPEISTPTRSSSVIPCH